MLLSHSAEFLYLGIWNGIKHFEWTSEYFDKVLYCIHLKAEFSTLSFSNVIFNESRTVARWCTNSLRIPKNTSQSKATSYWTAHTISWLPFQHLSPAGSIKWAFLFTRDKNQSAPTVLLNYYQFIRDQGSNNTPSVFSFSFSSFFLKNNIYSIISTSADVNI